MTRFPEGAGHGAARPGFARRFGELPAAPLDDGLLQDVLERIHDAPLGSDPNERIPAGYTYLAQFVDHDVTFDPVSQLDASADLARLRKFRSPRLDLDNVYGTGPADQPYLYEATGEQRGVAMLIGRPRDPALAAEDLPRNAQGVALIGDPRNDENLLVAQLHLLMLRAHNRFAEGLAQTAGAERLAEARRLLTWHYQWAVVHDLLDRIAGPEAGAAARERASAAPPEAAPAVAVEFSGAAYRFGHSMVRLDYGVNAAAHAVPIMPEAGEEALPHLRGGRPLPRGLVVDWGRFFFNGSGSGNTSLRIDHRLSPRLRRVPPDGRDLAELNLRRGHTLGLPAGAAVAAALGEAPLERDELLGLDPATAPLWFYVLREADARGAGGQRLGPVGGRIVADQLCGLLAADPDGYLRAAPGWTPELCDDARSTFTMLDLVRFAQS